MSLIELVIVISVTALLSSALTGFIVYFLAKKLYYEDIDPALDKLPDRIAEKVEAGVERAADTLLPRFEDRVKKGVLSAIKDSPKLGPEFTASALEAGLSSLGTILGADQTRKR